MRKANRQKKASLRYGTGELYGHDFANLSAEQIRSLANAAFKSQPCPFRGGGFMCNKKGGVCSLRQFSQSDDAVVPVDGASPVTTCPSRFYDSGRALAWAGETLIGTKTPIVLTELPFLKAISSCDASNGSTVGKIDMVLVHPNTQTLRWCALEIQAVYFSGASMSKDFNMMKKWKGKGVPFPQGFRHPGFRSSGPKR